MTQGILMSKILFAADFRKKEDEDRCNNLKIND